MQTRLIVTNGLKTNEEWAALDHYGKVVWLSTLTDLELRAQASVRVAHGASSVEAVLRSWVACGYLSQERIVAALSAEVAR